MSLIDTIDLSQVQVFNSPHDIASWPATYPITKLTFDPHAGVLFESPALDAWPDFTPAGWKGPLQYTVWPVVRINGVLYTSGIIQMWKGRQGTGAPPLLDNNFAKNWVYDSRWGPMAGYQPQAGELVGFFLSAGNARGEDGVTSVRERTDVVSVPMSASASFTFSTPSPVPPVPPVPPPTPDALNTIIAQLGIIAAKQAEHSNKELDLLTGIRRDLTQLFAILPALLKKK